MVFPEVPFDHDEDLFPMVRAAQQLRRMDVQPVLVEPDSPAQALPRRGYYVPAGFLRPGAPAAVVVREDYEGSGREEEMVLMRGALHHAAARTGVRPSTVIACDEAASPCTAEEVALIRQELAEWWSWWAPRNQRVVRSPREVALSAA